MSRREAHLGGAQAVHEHLVLQAECQLQVARGAGHTHQRRVQALIRLHTIPAAPKHISLNTCTGAPRYKWTL